MGAHPVKWVCDDCCVAGILAFGVKESATFTKIFTFVNLLVLGYVVICGCFKIYGGNWFIDASLALSGNYFVPTFVVPVCFWNCRDEFLCSHLSCLSILGRKSFSTYASGSRCWRLCAFWIQWGCVGRRHLLLRLCWL